LASQGAADLLERFEVYSYCPSFFQPPQSCMTDTRLLRQPVEGALFLSQQFVEPDDNHNRGTVFTTPNIYCRSGMYSVVETHKSSYELATTLMGKAL